MVMVSMRLYKRVRVSLVALLLSILVPINVAVAELRIEVTKGVDDAVRVAVVPFHTKTVAGCRWILRKSSILI